MVSMALCDFLMRQGEKPYLVECDTSNPDVIKAYHQEVKNGDISASSVNLDDDEGWEVLADILATHPDKPVVVNTAARNNDSVAKRGWYLIRGAAELSRPLVTLWVVNRQRDSLELLRQFQEALAQWGGESKVHVLRNLYFGEEKKFELYEGSRIRAAVEAAGGKSLSFPDLSDRVSDAVYSNRLSLTRAAKELSYGLRIGFEHWRDQADGVFRAALG
ncbi:protein mobD [Myxococcus llanfairpwllgwyngyllgogerychwyrndrobwllllantysiliogogogochensis]|uniref:Protein mobD n=2 Tax=Myxococcus llanfairpwllgwyngyllgogerychwyrndrobwllllantysiliogogogochensis TaxID=2590453 RepID=A0A540WU99_9BACT|nr:protein mobD [Myxococcus llanfairpwllgwyngyllgogerychwyrndrobwllllantysiliogogogochensis]